MPQTSIRSLARQLGLSASTVSLALRGSDQVVPSTRKRVLQAAKRDGYRVNPLVRSVMAALRRSSQESFQGALLALNYSEEDKPVQMAYHREVFSGAQRRARSLRYSMELCRVGSKQVTLARLNTIVRTRNVQGLVVMPFAESRDFSALDWSPLAAVVMDYCLTAPALHSVLPDHHVSMMRALELLKKRGYVRPGLVVTEARDGRVMHKRSAGFISHFRKLRRAMPVPPIQIDGMTRGEFLRWFRKYRPDVVLAHRQEEIVRWLGEEGFLVPRDVGFVQLNWTERSSTCAAMDMQPALLGAVAVESVVAQLQRNEQGVPENPKTITLVSRWVDGPTLRPARSG